MFTRTLTRTRRVRLGLPVVALAATLLATLVAPRPAEAAENAVAITSPSPLPDAHVGFPYAQQLTASGGTGSYTWSICTGWTAPGGMTLTSGGLLSGSPDSSLYATTFIVCVKVASGGTSAVGLLELEIDIEDGDGPNPVITSTEMPPARTNRNYYYEFEAEGGDGSGYTWQLCPGWSTPDGLSLSSYGAISGKPQKSVAKTTQTICVRVISGGATSGLYSLLIDRWGAGTAPDIVTDSLPDAVAGRAYDVTLEVQGGEGPPYQWAMCDGWAPPEGMVLDSDGRLHGTASPSQASATINVCVSVESGGGKSGSSKILPLFIQPSSTTFPIRLGRAKASPSRLGISEGDALKWNNRSRGRRVITSDDGATVYASLRRGTSFRLKLPEPGSYTFRERVTGVVFTVTVSDRPEEQP